MIPRTGTGGDARRSTRNLAFSQSAFSHWVAERAAFARPLPTLLLEQRKQFLHVLFAGAKVHRVDAKPGLALEFRG